MRVFLFCLMVLAFMAPARADVADDCATSKDWDLKIGACTAVIRSGDYVGKDLAWAYNNRGWAYRNLEMHQRSLEEYDQAIHLDPNRHRLFQSRCRLPASLPG